MISFQNIFIKVGKMKEEEFKNMTREELAIIRKRLLASTEGVWRACTYSKSGIDYEDGAKCNRVYVDEVEHKGHGFEIIICDSEIPTPDITFIAHAHQDILLLLDEVESLKCEIGLLKMGFKTGS